MKLFTQIWNERKHNVSIWLEMLVVSVILWFVIDSLYVMLSTYYEPKGFDIENTYELKFQSISKKNPRYKDPNDGGIDNGKAILEIMARLRNHPDVENVCISKISTPYCEGSMACQCSCDSFQDVFQQRIVSFDFPKVFKIKGKQGETPEQLSEQLRESNILISSFFHPDIDLRNKQIYGLSSDSIGVKVGAVINIVKHNEFSTPWKDVVYTCYSENTIATQYKPDMMTHVYLRVKEGTNKDFDKRIYSMASSQYQVGNLLLTDIHSMDSVREITVKSSINTFTIKLGIILFLLVNIFFGILGTFWFRTQQRRHEIALLRAIGSSQMHIYSRIITEGMVLLSAGSVCAWIINYFIAKVQLNTAFYGETLTIGRFLFTIGLTFVCMATMVVVGIAIPARKAQKIEISTALHED